MKWLIILILTVLLTASVVLAENPADLTATGYVNDFAKVITPEWKAKIDTLAMEMQRNETAEIAVVTVKNLGGLTREQFGIELAEKWGVGKKGKDNGILLLFAIDDRDWRIDVGYGLEGDLNDAKIGRIGREFIVSNFKAGDYGKGIYETIDEMRKYIEQDPTVTEITQEEKNAGIFILLSAIFYFIVFISTIKSKKKYKIGLGASTVVITIAAIISLTILGFIVTMFFWGILFMHFANKNAGKTTYIGGMPFKFGGGGLGGGSGGFSGFGGGSFGGGGAGGRW